MLPLPAYTSYVAKNSSNKKDWWDTGIVCQCCQTGQANHAHYPSNSSLHDKQTPGKANAQRRVGGSKKLAPKREPNNQLMCQSSRNLSEHTKQKQQKTCDQLWHMQERMLGPSKTKVMLPLPAYTSYVAKNSSNKKDWWDTGIVCQCCQTGQANHAHYQPLGVPPILENMQPQPLPAFRAAMDTRRRWTRTHANTTTT
jgi:hypothetical protein